MAVVLNALRALDGDHLETPAGSRAQQADRPWPQGGVGAQGQKRGIAMTWTVADVMTRDVVTVGPTASFKTCADLMRLHGVSALPVVVAGNHLAGIVSEADLMPKVARVPDDLELPVPSVGDKEAAATAAQLMTSELATIGAGASIAAAARLMSERKVKRLPVVDASNRLVGIISRGDVLRIFLRADESIRKEVAHGLLNELPLLGRGRVKVEVRDGVVQLTGEVESGSLTGLLVRLVAAVPGVVGVENHLKFAADPRAAEAVEPRARGGKVA